MIRLVEDPWESVDLQPCALRPCETNIGLATVRAMLRAVDVDVNHFTPYYDVTETGSEPARFCEECGSWLRDAMRIEVTSDRVEN